jgi:flagellar M-ring protein FliF
MPARQFVSKLTPKGWLAVGGAAAVAIVFLVLIFQMASAPSYSILQAGIDPAQTGRMTAALDSKGISYQLQNNGTALAVQPSQMGQARVALATAGLLSGTSSSPLAQASKSMPLGASTAQQQMIYQNALETQLAQTIEQIQGVSSAQVQLVLPDPTQVAFGNASPATAAVLLSDSGSLDPNAVRGIAQLVSSSVPNLALNKVTITDSTGQLLWPSADSAGGDGSLISKQAAEARYDSAVASQINAMLAQTLGPGKAVVQVNADLNTDQITQQQLTYANKGVPLQQQTQKETLTGTGAGAAGLAGTAGNIPATAGTTAANGRSNYNNTSTTTTFGVTKTVTQRTVAPGAINRQSVSVLVSNSVPPSVLPNIQKAVAAAAGINAKRGDTVSVLPMAFAKPATPPAPAATTKYIGYAKYALIGLGALFFLFFVSRMLRRREREALVGEPTWLRELEVARPLPALAGAGAGGALGGGARAEMAAVEPPTQVIPLQAPVNVARRQVEDLVERDADRVAQQVRAWMSED